MTGNPVIQALVTVLAAAVAAFHLHDLGSRHSLRTRLNAAIHLLMAAGMAVMVWPSGMQVPPALGTGVFCAAAAVYAWQIIVPERDRPSSGLESDHLHGALLWYHLAMTASMAWMFAAVGMLPPAPGRQTPAMPAAVQGMDSSMTMSTGLSGWPALASWACLVLFLVALPVFAGLLLRSFARRGPGRAAGERRRTAAFLCMAMAMLIGFGMLLLP